MARDTIEFLFRSGDVCFVGVGSAVHGYTPRKGEASDLVVFENRIREACASSQPLAQLSEHAILLMREGEEAVADEAPAPSTLDPSESPFEAVEDVYHDYMKDKSADFIAGLRIGYDLGFYDSIAGDLPPEGVEEPAREGAE